MIHCLVFTENPPWYNFVLKEDLGTIETRPLLRLRSVGRRTLPSAVGELVYLYLKFPEGEEIAKDPRAIFFEYSARDKRFGEVTEQVRTGTKKVEFFDPRREVPSDESGRAHPSPEVHHASIAIPFLGYTPVDIAPLRW